MAVLVTGIVWDICFCIMRLGSHSRIKELEDVELEELERLLSEGYSVRDCAEEMGKSKGAIQRLKRKLEEEN